LASLLLSTDIHSIYLLEIQRKKEERKPFIRIRGNKTRFASSNRRRKKRFVLIPTSPRRQSSHVVFSSAGSTQKIRDGERNLAIDRRIKKANASKVPIGCGFTWIGWMSMGDRKDTGSNRDKKATNTYIRTH